ncbi:MAG: folate family ECF transporter S component, partial [Clostridia bacterium]|nr:folate family ECF transporter S component [Clostridia bacterium]
MKKKRKSLFINVKSLTFCAMLVSLSVILAIIAKLIPQGVPYLRFTFENLPIIASGFIFGPIAGGIVGILCDLVSCLVIPQQSFNPLITIGPCAIGIISGFLFKYCFKGRKKYIFFLISTLL